MSWIFLVSLLLLVALLSLSGGVGAFPLHVAGDRFVDEQGKPVIVQAGCAHYFRITPELFSDRILRAKAMGYA